MSKQIDLKRRKVICLGGILGLTLLLSPIVRADGITDLLTDDGVSDDQNQIVAVRIWPSSVYTRVTLEAENSLDVSAIDSPDPKKLIVDIKNVQLNAMLNSMGSKILNDDPIISGIKAEQYNSNTVRLTVYLKQAIKTQTRVLLPVKLGSVSYQYRYVLDMYPLPDGQSSGDLNDDMLALLQLHDNNDDEKSPPILAKKPELTTTENAIAAPPPITPDDLPDVTVKSRSGKKLLVMLDPGHGGEDPGAVGPMGTCEKDIVLDIAQRVCDLINQSGNMSAKLTRSQDIFIPLGTRVAIARKAKADIFVSIHADAFTTPQAKGASVFVLSDKSASSSSARWLAKTQNDSDLIGGMSFQQKDKIISKVLLDMTQTWTSKKSIKLGQTLLNGLSGIGKLHNGNVEKAGFAVLKAPDIPSVLVETAFISNPEEEKLLRQVEFRQKMANTIFRGLNSFMQTI